MGGHCHFHAVGVVGAGSAENTSPCLIKVSCTPISSSLISPAFQAEMRRSAAPRITTQMRHINYIPFHHIYLARSELYPWIVVQANQNMNRKVCATHRHPVIPGRLQLCALPCEYRPLASKDTKSLNHAHLPAGRQQVWRTNPLCTMVTGCARVTTRVYSLFRRSNLVGWLYWLIGTPMDAQLLMFGGCGCAVLVN